LVSVALCAASGDTRRMLVQRSTSPTTGVAVARVALCILGVVSVLGACGAPASHPASPEPPAAAEPTLRRVEAPTVPLESEALAELPGLRSDHVALAVAFPERFDAAHEHPILITQVATNPSRSNIDGLTAYAPTALAAGYVVLAAQGIPWPPTPRSDTIAHRYASVRAALRWLAGEVPPSQGWPVVLAGFSGGAKITQALVFSLLLEGRRVGGVFLGGCNEGYSELLLREFPAAKERFTQVPFFLSVGEEDRISPPDSVRAVANELRRSGVQRVELSVHRGGHRLDPHDLGKALGWLRARSPEPAGR
ncbi:MAG TPA: hypothetical protein VMG12_35320, partial [Polyangiaceae bacterium]|nr:hypothetical protein [Polyangiaceae bacterium]